MDAKEVWVVNNTIHRIIAGSRLYGTERSDSDYDVRGVCLMPKRALLGLDTFEQWQRQVGEDDIVIYGLVKFVKLALQNNPNIMELLFAPPEKWAVRSAYWKAIYSSRHLFLSQRVRVTMAGYAKSQLHRMKRHYSWLHTPPHKLPPEEFGGALVSGKSGAQKLEFPNQQLRQDYESQLKRWKDYDKWLRDRNPARAKLERQHGYDTKHAANLVRMLLQAEEILGSCDFNPVLNLKTKLAVVDVYNGEHDYETILKIARQLDNTVRAMPSDLQEQPDVENVHKTLITINWMSLLKQGS